MWLLVCRVSIDQCVLALVLCYFHFKAPTYINRTYIVIGMCLILEPCLVWMLVCRVSIDQCVLALCYVTSILEHQPTSIEPT